MNLFLMFNKGHSGSNKAAVLSVLVESWLANPQKDCSSVHVDGEENFVMASVITESTLYLSDNTEALQMLPVWC